MNKTNALEYFYEIHDNKKAKNNNKEELWQSAIVPFQKRELHHYEPSQYLSLKCLTKGLPPMIKAIEGKNSTLLSEKKVNKVSEEVYKKILRLVLSEKRPQADENNFYINLLIDKLDEEVFKDGHIVVEEIRNHLYIEINGKPICILNLEGIEVYFRETSNFIISFIENYLERKRNLEIIYNEDITLFGDALTFTIRLDQNYKIYQGIKSLVEEKFWYEKIFTKEKD